MKSTKMLATAALAATLALTGGFAARAATFVKDVMLIGGSKTEVNSLKSTYAAQGWTLVDYDLNKGCGNTSDYIYLLYKPEAAASNAATYTVTGETSGSATTFTVTRSESADAETVLYRTVGLSAFPGQHFTEASGSLEFAAGETEKSVSVTERTPTDAAYMFQTGTTRSYRFEVTDAAGFPLAYNDRSITTGTSVPSSGIFTEKTVTVNSGTITVTDDGYAQAYHSVPISSYFSGAASQSYLAAVGAELRMLVTFNAYEKDDGYQYIQIIANNTSDCDTGADGGDPGTPSVSRYMAGFEHGDGASEFGVGIEFVDGEPVITWSPDLGAERTYTIQGKANLEDEWEEVDGNASDYRFFKVTVEMR